MRRKDKEITDKKEIESIIGSSSVCRLGMVDNGVPYVVPLCFGYKNNILYFHSATKGKKVEALKKNSNVCVEFDVDAVIEKGEDACHWGMHFKSVIGFGTASTVTDPEAKREAFDVIMAQYAKEHAAYTYAEADVNPVVIIRVDIESMTGKKS